MDEYEVGIEGLDGTTTMKVEGNIMDVLVEMLERGIRLGDIESIRKVYYLEDPTSFHPTRKLS